MLEKHCKLCLDQQKDCCINGLKKYNLRVFASKEEVRISNAYGVFEKINLNNFSNQQTKDYQLRDYDPIWKRIFTEYKEFYFLKEPCQCISPQGCGLGDEKKPFICLIFPADFNLTKREIIYNQKETDYIPCKAKKKYNFDKYLTNFNITKDFLQNRLNKYYAQLKKEFPKAFT